MTSGILTIQAMIDRVTADLGGPIASTVDTVKVGDTAQVVRGAVTTFMATIPVIRRAIDLGANLIVTHEPTFFNHHDEVAFLQDDPVYRAKRRLLEESGLVVYRLHDYPHGAAKVSTTDLAGSGGSGDPFAEGLLEAMRWQAYADPQAPSFCTIPPITLGELIRQLKDRLQLDTVRVTGNPEQQCSRVLLLFGAVGIQFQITALSHFAADVVITGECPEWESFSYAADAGALGIKRALIAVGHQQSEEPGMARLTAWLRERFPTVTITHVPAANPVRTY